LHPGDTVAAADPDWSVWLGHAQQDQGIPRMAVHCDHRASEVGEQAVQQAAVIWRASTFCSPLPARSNGRTGKGTSESGFRRLATLATAFGLDSVDSPRGRSVGPDSAMVPLIHFVSAVPHDPR
jgi:hypothetical protein